MARPKKPDPISRARREAADLAVSRVAERSKRLNNHVVATAELMAEAKEMRKQADATRDAAYREADVRHDRAYQEAAAKESGINRHLVALLKYDFNAAEIARLCKVPVSTVRAARNHARTAEQASDNTSAPDVVRPPEISPSYTPQPDMAARTGNDVTRDHIYDTTRES